MGAFRLDVVGVPFVTDDGRKFVRARAHAALVAYTPYLIEETSQSQTVDGVTTVEGDAVTFACGAVATTIRQYGVPQRDWAADEIAELQCGGPGKLNVDNTTGAILATSWLKIIPGTSAILGQLDGTKKSNSSIARSCEAMDSATDAAIQVQFIPTPVVVNT
jgi:hypothetical protein